MKLPSKLPIDPSQVHSNNHLLGGQAYLIDKNDDKRLTEDLCGNARYQQSLVVLHSAKAVKKTVQNQNTVFPGIAFSNWR